MKQITDYSGARRCAADKNQAKIVFDVAADMVRFSKSLSKRIKIYESQKKLEYLPTKSTYQVLSADVSNKHGFNTHGVIFDELHTQPNRKLYDVMVQGSGDARMQPLYFLITTAGNNTESICYEVHQKALDIMELTLEQKIAHGGHPVLRWNMDNIFIRQDPAGNIKADKSKSTEKIDGAIACIMALDRAIRCGNDASESVYDTRGLLVF